MPPTKRARPSFSPPRPGKNKNAKVNTSKRGSDLAEETVSDSKRGRSKSSAAAPKARSNGDASKSKPSTSKNRASSNIRQDYTSTGVAERRAGLSKHAGKRGTRAAILSEDEEEDAFETRSRRQPARSALDLLDQSADEEEDEEADEDDGDNIAEQDKNTESDTQSVFDRSNPDDVSSPEPDFMIAEITTDTSATSHVPIPGQLVHRMLHHHFERPNKTKISSDARELVTKYIEVFVREAIMRSAFEREGVEGQTAVVGSGFLEVEDLEKAAVQLCLDF